MTPVAVRSLSVRFGDAAVLAGVDLDVAAGELFFLLGPSGCGKTTLLRAVAGFVQPNAGAIRFGDQDVTRLPPEARGIGMVFQHYALWPHLDVGGNVAFGLEVQRVPAAERTQRVADALKQVELTGFERRRVGELSGGQQQRVALARALVVRPRVLLLDEPLSNLDPRLRHQMRDAIRKACKDAGVTAIYVTHDLHEALAAGDRVGVLLGGKLAQVAAPRELYERPASRAVAQFLGATNLLDGELTAPDAVRCALGTLRTRAVTPGLAAGAKVAVCLRPERVRLGGGDGDANRLDARVVDSRYFGATAEIALAVGDAHLVAHEPAPPPRAAGDAVSAAIAPADVVVLPA